MRVARITQPTRYKNAIIAPRPDDTFDVCTDIGWFNVGTQKRAKWWASVYSTIRTMSSLNLTVRNLEREAREETNHVG